MKSASTRISLLEREDGPPTGFHTAVSLHAHSRHSKEYLGFVDRCAGRIPILSRFYRLERNRYHWQQGKDLDFSQAYWTPPLPAQKVCESEKNKIHGSLGLEAFVSLTDHDAIAQRVPPQDAYASQKMPVSLEWSVPIGINLVHLGVHNLPFHKSKHILQELLSYTAHPREAVLGDLLTWLNEDPGTLVVFNHPFSDLKPVGRDVLRRFVGGLSASLQQQNSCRRNQRVSKLE